MFVCTIFSFPASFRCASLLQVSFSTSSILTQATSVCVLQIVLDILLEQVWDFSMSDANSDTFGNDRERSMSQESRSSRSHTSNRFQECGTRFYSMDTMFYWYSRSLFAFTLHHGAFWASFPWLYRAVSSKQGYSSQTPSIPSPLVCN